MAAYQQYKILLKTLADLTGISRLGRALTKHSGLVRNAVRAYKGLKTVVKATFNIAAGAIKGIATMAAANVAVVGGAVRMAQKNNVELAKAVNMFGGNLGQKLKNFRRFRNEAREVSVATGESVAGIIAALYDLGSKAPKGMEEGLVKPFLEASAKIAATDPSASVQDAANLLTTMLNAWSSQDASDAVDVADLLAKGIEIAGTNYQELASYIGQVAPEADAANVSMRETIAGIATMTKGGKGASESVTQLNALLMGLNKALGQGWRDDFESMQAAAQHVYELTKGNQEELAKMGFNETAQKALTSLSGKKAEAAATSLKEMADASGKLDEAFSFIVLFNHWERNLRATQTIMDDLGESIDNVLKPIVNSVTDALAQWREKTTFFDALEAKLTRARELAGEIWTAVATGGEGGTLLEGLKEGALGIAQGAGDLVIDVLAKAMPVLGELLWRGLKAAASEPFKQAARAKTAVDLAEAGQISKSQAIFYSGTGGWIGSRDTKTKISAARRADRIQESRRIAAEMPGGETDHMGNAKQIFGGLAGRGREMQSPHMAQMLAEARAAAAKFESNAREMAGLVVEMGGTLDTFRTELDNTKSQVKNARSRGG